MTDDVGKHVFVSYVREDSDAVDALCAVLEAGGIPYWRDRNDLGPGDAWQAKIKSAIRDGALVFLACFSENSRLRDRSGMNEELTLAVDEFRQMPPGRVWLMPLRLDDGPLPGWDLGAGRSLYTLNYTDLFGPGHMVNATRLVTTIQRLMGEQRPDAATAMAAVEQVANADRTDLLKRMTKEMLPDPARRIQLDDLVSQEAQRVVAVLIDRTLVATGRLSGSNNEQVVQVANAAAELWAVAQPFCQSLQVAARWGTPDQLVPWVNGLRGFLSVAMRPEGGNTALLNLRFLPGTVGIVTAALASGPSRNWASLRALVIEPTVRDRDRDKAAPLVECTNPYEPFGNTEWVPLALARGAIHGLDYAEALQDFTSKKQPKLLAPVSEWFHHILRPLFVDQFADQDTYDAEWDRAEVMLTLLAQDQVLARLSGGADQWANKWAPRWYGRSTYRAAYGRANPVFDFTQELAAQGTAWGPLEGRLFGGDPKRAEAAVDALAQEFHEVGRRRF